MLFVVVIMFAVMWLPLQTFSMIMFLFPDVRGGYQYQSFGYNIFIVSYFCCHWLSMAHSCLNPLIYCFMNDKFRTDLHELICSRRRSGLNNNNNNSITGTATVSVLPAATNVASVSNGQELMKPDEAIHGAADPSKVNVEVQVKVNVNQGGKYLTTTATAAAGNQVSDLGHYEAGQLAQGHPDGTTGRLVELAKNSSSQSKGGKPSNGFALGAFRFNRRKGHRCAAQRVPVEARSAASSEPDQSRSDDTYVLTCAGEVSPKQTEVTLGHEQNDIMVQLCTPKPLFAKVALKYDEKTVSAGCEQAAANDVSFAESQRQESHNEEPRLHGQDEDGSEEGSSDKGGGGTREERL